MLKWEPISTFIIHYLIFNISVLFSRNIVTFRAKSFFAGDLTPGANSGLNGFLSSPFFYIGALEFSTIYIQENNISG